MEPFSTKDMDDALPEVKQDMAPVSRLDQEAATVARDKGWVQPEKYNYGRFLGPNSGNVGGDNSSSEDLPWASDARKYEWKEEYGEVGPSDEELEKMLFRHDFINRVGLKFDK